MKHFPGELVVVEADEGEVRITVRDFNYGLPLERERDKGGRAKR